MRVARWLLTTAGVAAVLAVAGGATRRPVVAVPPPTLPEVAVAFPRLARVPESATYPAHVEPIQRVELRPRVAGHIESIHFEEGATVAKGQVLARLDARPYRVAVANAEAGVRRARAEADRSRREADRAGRLFDRKAVSEEEAEHRAAAAEMALAQLGQAQAALERARLDLEYTELRAPIAGRIGRSEVTAGNLVDSETRLAVIVSMNPVYVRFDVDEATAARHAGKPWEAMVRLPGREAVPGRLAFLDNEVSSGTGTLRARALVPNPRGELVPGMYGQVEVIFGHAPEALLVEETVVGTDQGQRFVLVAGKDDVVEYRPVQLGARQGTQRVASGLTAADRVLVSGLAIVRPGMKVRPMAAQEKE